MYPLNKPDNSGKLQPATQGCFFPSAVKICPSSCSALASVRAQNPSSVSHQLSQHSPRLLKPSRTTLPTWNSSAQHGCCWAALLGRQRKSDTTGRSPAVLTTDGFISLAYGWWVQPVAGYSLAIGEKGL